MGTTCWHILTLSYLVKVDVLWEHVHVLQPSLPQEFRIWNLTLESLMEVTLGVKSAQESIKILSRHLFHLVCEIMAQTGVSILGGFRVVESECKVQIGQTW